MESIIWFLVIGVLFYLMMRFGCGAHTGGHGEGHEGHMGHGEGPPTLSQKVKDPVCGMEIDRDHSYAMVKKGERQIYFCSQNCQNKFNEKPDKFL